MILDASVLIALLDTADAHHARAVDEVEAADQQSAELRARHDHLRLPDAMVLATAQQLHGPLKSFDHRLERYAGSEAAVDTGQPGD